ncbi:MAG: protein kinase [Gammaproteobacteria bacterium 28-57-27]|nr:MAG: protein kinase [Gammaproteobacteria bacterium 28-57-27]
MTQLQSGALAQSKRLSLSEGLSAFPREIFELADSLEYLDLSANQLDSLPDDFGRLHKLKILFLSTNRFTELPKVLADCPELEMIGFKSNVIAHMPEHGLPPKLRWLILTDNRIEKLPHSMGQLTRLQKLMLAGNALTQVPDSLQHCTQLELIRLSANRLTQFPHHLLQLPRLAWLAFAGNPFCALPAEHTARPRVALDDLRLLEALGQGASGVIYRAEWRRRPEGLADPDAQIAVKLFKGQVTSDGYAQDEMQASLDAGAHPSLVAVLASIADHGQTGLVMRLIPAGFTNLGQPPSLTSCTRDTFAEGAQRPLTQLLDMACSMADVLAHVHARGLSHGDVYAHNILCDSDGRILFGDFGAAARFDYLPEPQQQAIQMIELRAFGHLLDDMLSLCADGAQNQATFDALRRVQVRCVLVNAGANVSANASTALDMRGVKQVLDRLRAGV